MCRVIITDTVISGSIVCFPVGSLIQCRRANDDFLNIFFFYCATWISRGHLPSTDVSIFHFSFSSICIVEIGFRVCTKRNEFEKNDFEKCFSLSLECSAIIKPSGTLVNFTVHPEKPERAPNFYDFKMSFKIMCVFFFHYNDLSGLSLIYPPILNLCQLQNVCNPEIIRPRINERSSNS